MQQSSQAQSCTVPQQPSQPVQLPATAPTLPLPAYLQQQRFQAVQQPLHDHQLTHKQPQDTNRQVWQQQHEQLLSQQQQQSALLTGHTVHAQLPVHQTSLLEPRLQSHSAQAKASSNAPQTQHSQVPQHAQSAAAQTLSQSSGYRPSQPVGQAAPAAAQQPVPSGQKLEASATRSLPQISVAATHLQSTTPQLATGNWPAPRAQAQVQPQPQALQAAGHFPAQPRVISRPASDAASQPALFRPQPSVWRPATHAAAQPRASQSPAVYRPGGHAAAQTTGALPQPAHGPAQQAPAAGPAAISRPASDAADQGLPTRLAAGYRPASDAAQQGAKPRPAAISRPASDAAEQALESRASGVPPPSGKLVWAKLTRYPWWPAEILTASDPYIPEGEEPPRLGAVPVRFFGTYSFAWIESKRAIEPFDQEHMQHASESRQTEFLRGVGEANHYQATGELPQGFAVTLQQLFEEQQAAKAKAAAKAGRGTGEDQQDTGKGKKGQKRVIDDPVAAEHARHRAVTARKLRLQRQLGLAPPAGSPFANLNSPCLDGFAPVAARLGWVQPVKSSS